MSFTITAIFESDTFHAISRNMFYVRETVTKCAINMHSSFLPVQLEKSLACSFGAKSRPGSSAVQRTELKQGSACVDAGQEFLKGVSSGGACLSIRDLWKSCRDFQQGPLCQIPP